MSGQAVNPEPRDQRPQPVPPAPDVLYAVRSRVGKIGVLATLERLNKIARRRAQA